MNETKGSDATALSGRLRLEDGPCRNCAEHIAKTSKARRDLALVTGKSKDLLIALETERDLTIQNLLCLAELLDLPERETLRDLKGTHELTTELVRCVSQQLDRMSKANTVKALVNKGRRCCLV